MRATMISAAAAATAAMIALSLTGPATASLPSVQEALANCEVAASHSGACQVLPPTSACAPYFPAGQQVYLPTGNTMEVVENIVVVQIRSAIRSKPFFTSDCFKFSVAFICTSHFFPCIATDNASEPIPRLPCAQFCADYWQVCSDTFYQDWAQVIQSNYLTSTIPNCYNGTFNSSWTAGTLVAQPQPPDVWGGRPIPSWIVTVEGLNGTALFPLSTYTYSFANGSAASEQCYIPSEIIEVGALPATQCTAPLEISQDSLTCDLPCPFPLYSTDIQHAIEWAFIAPAILGLALCLFNFFVSLHEIYQASGGMMKRTLFSSSGQGSSDASNDAKKKHQLRASTFYALEGSLLGFIYFVIGPLQTLIYWENISCPTSTISLTAIAAESFPPSPSACAAQRVAPFVLQAIFNLVFFAMINVYRVLINSTRSMSANRKRIMEAATLVYCVGLPLITMIVAFALDKVSQNILVASVQLARQSTICQFRLEPTTEWLLIFAPFISTGAGVTYVSIRIVSKIAIAKRQLGTPGILTTKTASDVALVSLMFRLMTLGLLTFVILIIVITTTTIMTNEITLYSAAYTEYFTCLAQPLSCVNCSLWGTLATKRQPQPVVIGVQLAAMSSILLIFGFFFSTQSASRLFKEWKDGKLKLGLPRFGHKSRQGPGNPSASGVTLDHPIVTSDARVDSEIKAMQ